MEAAADGARAEADDVVLEMKLLEERHDEIFSQLEDAVTISMQPLDQVFSSVGIDPNNLIAEVRRGYSGQGGPLGMITPPAMSGSKDPAAQADFDRAARILDGLDRMNLYRIAIVKTPLSMPLKTSFRFTSGFGRRWGRMHEGLDLAGAYGSPVYTTADGFVTHAGWESGYGNMVEVRHPFGLSTRYGHLSAVKVTVGQKVSRGDRIGDMGNTGRSTGTHLHYEVRVGGSAVNPMSFIKAATNVF
jgi:murein DD-endopeptidase MepM/ murein hydrolase activator NlpD